MSSVGAALPCVFAQLIRLQELCFVLFVGFKP